MNATTIAEMEKESARLKSLAQNIDAVIEAYKRTDTTNGGTVGRIHPPVVKAPVDRLTRTSATFSSMNQADVVFQILSNAQKELNRDEIYQQAVAGGACFHSAKHISPVLSRDKRFLQVGRGFWKIDQDHQSYALRPSGELYTVREIIRKAGKPVLLSEIVNQLGYGNESQEGNRGKYASLRGTITGYASEGKVFTIESKSPHLIGLIEFKSQTLVPPRPKSVEAIASANKPWDAL